MKRLLCLALLLSVVGLSAVFKGRLGMNLVDEKNKKVTSTAQLKEFGLRSVESLIKNKTLKSYKDIKSGTPVFVPSLVGPYVLRRVIGLNQGYFNPKHCKYILGDGSSLAPDSVYVAIKAEWDPEGIKIKSVW